MSQLRVAYDIVKGLLQENVGYRDDDNTLIARYWWEECMAMEPQVNLKNISAVQFLELLRDKKLTESDTITRARRKVQENEPSLRGTKWFKRHKKVLEVKKEIQRM